ERHTRTPRALSSGAAAYRNPLFCTPPLLPAQLRQAMLLAADERLPLRAGPALHLLLRGECFSHRAELLDVDELDRHAPTRVGAPSPEACCCMRASRSRAEPT